MKLPLKLKLAVWFIATKFKTNKSSFIPSTDHHKALDDFVRANNYPAIAAFNYQPGSDIYISFAGHKNHKYKSRPDLKTVFRWYSITKSFTAIAIMQLAEKDLLSVDDIIGSHINFPDSDRIKIKHLLNHTSGIPPEGPELLSWSHYSKDTYIGTSSFAEQIVQSFRKYNSQPGKQYAYSNFGYHLLGLIIEKVSGQKNDDYITNNIIEPLGLKNTFFYPTAECNNYAEGQIERYSLYELLTKHYYPDNLEEDTPPSSVSYFSPFEFYPNTHAASGLFGSLEDLQTYGTALLNGFSGKENTLLRPDSFDKMLETTIPIKGKAAKKWQLCSGYGFKVGKSKDKEFIMTDGSAPGFCSALRIYKESKSIAGILTNRSPMPIYQVLDGLWL